MTYPKRTHFAGTLTKTNIGETVTLNGWVAVRRDLGGLIFADVRDYTGITQVVFSPQYSPQLSELASELRHEYVVAIKGEVRQREQINKNIFTGEIEIYCSELVIINKSEPTPIDVGKRDSTNEELLLKYRYIDLREKKLQDILRMRNNVYQITHKYFAENNFVEVETPILVKSTPEGARDYLVPSRIHHGKFYALPQSPQIYKQILMVSGIDRYVQITKCFRDEDLRADRQPEFTQIDFEMSFVDQEDVLQITEKYIAKVWQEIKGVEMKVPFMRMPYNEAMNRYGSDKPDIRFQMEIQDLTDLFINTEFNVFKKIFEFNGTIRGINFKGGAKYSRKQIDEIIDYAKKYGAGGLIWLKVNEEGFEGSNAKFVSKDESKNLIEKFNATMGDMILIVAEKKQIALNSIGQVRLEIAKREGIINKNENAPLFIIDFPMFEPDENNLPVPVHHAFTSYKKEDEHLLDINPFEVRANCYDLVINGYEIGSGSIRIFDKVTQSKIFDMMGLTIEEANTKFGFLLEAFRYGAPPHGGYGLGLDRMIMLLAGTENIRDVIAFPKTTSASSLMDETPSLVDEDLLKIIGIKLLQK